MKNKPVFPDPANAREQLVDRIWSDFNDVKMQLTAGLDQFLEEKGVSPAVREAVSEFVCDAVGKDLTKLEANVVRLADVPGATEAGYGIAGHGEKGTHLREHGHLTLSDLGKEIAADTEAAKREDAHGYGPVARS
jgi:hypothetical protein